MSRRLVYPEQLYAVGHDGEAFLVGGRRSGRIPWGAVGDAHLYALDVPTLELMLLDAVEGGFQVLDGQLSPRRGLRSMTVGIGAWGWRAKVSCQTLDAWAIELDEGIGAEQATEEAQRRLRACCERLNAEEVPFKTTAFRWLGSLYRRLGLPLEPDERCSSLGEDVATFCRRAHVGGPIIHARTTLEPFVHLDRKRSFGSIMRENLPSGPPLAIKLRGDGLDRWTPVDLKRALGIVEATVSVDEGPFMPLLPVHQQGIRFDRAKTLYPTGELRGTWALCELAWIEEAGLGKVTRIHKGYTFQGAPVFSSIVDYIRRLEQELPVAVKRCEHILYGRCAKGLSVTRIGNGPSAREARPLDLIDAGTWSRLHGHAEMRPARLRSKDGLVKARHTLMQLHGQMRPDAGFGAPERPDRAAWITARNRVELGKAIRKLDAALDPERSGEYIGRIYVDGIDIEAKPEQVPEIDGIELRDSGARMDIYRSSVFIRHYDDKPPKIELGSIAAGPGAEGVQTAEDIVSYLAMAPDVDGGPLAGGRAWQPHPEGPEHDPRSLAHQRSVPADVDTGFLAAMGFFEPDPGTLLGSRR